MGAFSVIVQLRRLIVYSTNSDYAAMNHPGHEDGERRPVCPRLGCCLCGARGRNIA